jgi:CarD family transcriptional regulator
MAASLPATLHCRSYPVASAIADDGHTLRPYGSHPICTEKSSSTPLTWAYAPQGGRESLISCWVDSPHTASDLRIRLRPGWDGGGVPCYPGHSERGFEPMVFSVGETVVYPHHGAALIEAIETRVIKGEEKQYLVLRVAQGDLTVRVPAENAEIVGVREVVGEEGLTKVFDVLRAPHTEEPTNWSRRYKANLEKLASGNPLKVAEVVRDLWRRERERGLSAGEKRMLAKARDILVGEVALAERSTKDEAETLLDKVLTEG